MWVRGLIRHLENRHDVIFFCRGWSDLNKFSQTGTERHVNCGDVWKWKPDSMACHPRATYHCHDSRATCHIAMSWSCHIVGCKNSIRHIENRFSPYFIFFLFLMQFRLWRAAAFVSSPIQLFVSTESTNATDRHRMTAQAALMHSIARQKKTNSCYGHDNLCPQVHWPACQHQLTTLHKRRTKDGQINSEPPPPRFYAGWGPTLKHIPRHIPRQLANSRRKRPILSSHDNFVWHTYVLFTLHLNHPCVNYNIVTCQHGELIYDCYNGSLEQQRVRRKI